MAAELWMLPLDTTNRGAAPWVTALRTADELTRLASWRAAARPVPSVTQ